MHLQNIKQNKTTFCRETTTFVGNEARFVVLFADGILSCIQLLGQWTYKKELNEKNYCSIPVTRPLLFLFWTSWFRWCPLCNGFKGHWNVSRFMPKWPLILTSRAFLPEKLPIKQQTLIRSNKQNKKKISWMSRVHQYHTWLGRSWRRARFGPGPGVAHLCQEDSGTQSPTAQPAEKDGVWGKDKDQNPGAGEK